MTSVAYRPQKYLLPGVKFGGAETAAPKEVSGIAEAARMRASLRQSNWSFVIRRRMQLEGMTLSGLADAMGVEYGRLGKVLRGYVIMTLVDFELANAVFDDRVNRRKQAAEAERERLLDLAADAGHRYSRSKR